MRITAIGFAAALMLGWFAGPLAAQQQEAAAPVPAAQPSTTIDASKLPLNLSKLHQKLKASTETRRPGLTFNIDVIGQAPRIQIFTPGEDLRYGPVPNTTPTHQEMIEIATPREFRSPVMDFSNLMRWIQSTLKRED